MPERPLIPLEPGEQYRFHFDMTKCVGCKCCEVACHEQNNNPAAVKWREVGEIEGGEYPQTVRLYVSMACNHCIEPSCLLGCPVDAYYKDPATGAVRMRDDACIGCGYCTWNCPYEAPQFNPERNLVTKCDFCHNRLVEGELPACVNACPSGALELEKVNLQEWVADLSSGNAPAVPEASITVSTTRFTVPEKLPELNRADDYRLKPQQPHYSLVLMTVLTQLSVGGFAALFLTALLRRGTDAQAYDSMPRLALLGTALLALVTSVFHLGRPLFAYRALRMWRRSWLSREVLFFTLFAGLAGLYSLWSIPLLGGLVVLTGLAGIYSSARIYMVPARPSWNNLRTPIGFFSTGFLLGPLVTLFLLERNAHQNFPCQNCPWLTGVILMAGLFQLGSILVKLFYLLSRDEHEMRGTARLLTQWFRVPFLVRIGSLVMVLISLPLAIGGNMGIGILLGVALLSELLGRYLFFVSVVPKNRPEGYYA